MKKLIFVALMSIFVVVKAQDKVLIKTNYGDIVVKLYDKTQYHKKNFLKLVREGFYDGLLFHRVKKDFMIQAGDPQSRNAKPGQRLGSGGPGYTIPAEICPEYFHKRGALAAARQSDQVNPTRRSSGSQFYIVTGKVYTDKELDVLELRLNTKFTPEQRKAYTTIGGAPYLDGQYTVFGEVIQGMDVVDKIQNVKTDKYDRPVQDVKIIKMQILR